MSKCTLLLYYFVKYSFGRLFKHISKKISNSKRFFFFPFFFFFHSKMSFAGVIDSYRMSHLHLPPKVRLIFVSLRLVYCLLRFSYLAS